MSGIVFTYEKEDNKNRCVGHWCFCWSMSGIDADMRPDCGEQC